MKEMGPRGIRPGARCAGFGAVAGVLLSLLLPASAAADTEVQLPDGGTVAVTGATRVEITRAGESAVVSPSLAANGAGRVAWVSGKVTFKVDIGVAEKVSVSTGYLLGCQVDADDLSLSASTVLDVDELDGKASLAVPLGSGDVKSVTVTSKSTTKTGVFVIEYTDFQIALQGCGGYAQARAVTTVKVAGNDYLMQRLYGQPFSIG